MNLILCHVKSLFISIVAVNPNPNVYTFGILRLFFVAAKIFAGIFIGHALTVCYFFKHWFRHNLMFHNLVFHNLVFHNLMFRNLIMYTI